MKTVFFVLASVFLTSFIQEGKAFTPWIKPQGDMHEAKRQLKVNTIAKQKFIIFTLAVLLSRFRGPYIKRIKKQNSFEKFDKNRHVAWTSMEHATIGQRTSAVYKRISPKPFNQS